MSTPNIKFAKINLIESNKGVQKQRCKLTDFDDSIYDTLSSKVNINDKIKIADFLDLFYYFIICYSKMCFKKHALWESKYIYFTHYKTKKAYRIGNTFNYQLANDTNAQSVLLTMQYKLNTYRKDYKNNKQTQHIYLNESRIKEMMTFIYEGLSDLANIIACPVPAISPDVNLKINKYININNVKKTNKINYDALSKILAE